MLQLSQLVQVVHLCLTLLLRRPSSVAERSLAVETVFTAASGTALIKPLLCLQLGNNAGRWTRVFFLIYYIRLDLTTEAECIAEEGKSGELMNQAGRFSARLEVEDCRGVFR